MSWHGSTALVWDADRLRTATDAAGVALWSWNVDTDEIALDERAHGLWDVPSGGSVTFEILSARIHPQDVGRVRQTMQATRDMKGAYEVDFRILHGDDIRWMSARWLSDERGIVERVMFGVFLDVTDCKRAELDREMLADEMSHRLKNLFAVASALTSIAARSATTTTEMARDLQQRLAALGRAHNCVQPAAIEMEDREQLLGGLFAVLLAPYAEDRSGRNRVYVLCQPFVSARARSRPSLSWCTSWRPIRSNTARSRRPTARSASLASCKVTTSTSFGPNALGRLWQPLADRRASAASSSPRAWPASWEAPLHTSETPQAWSSRCG